MSKPVKQMITDHLRDRYAGLDSALLIEFSGVDGNTNNAFRGELRQRDMRLEVVKSSLFCRAVKDTKLDPLCERMSGPSALLTGGESLIDVAKLLDEWSRKMSGVKLKAAVLEGEFLDEHQVAGLHKMPTKADLRAMIAGMILSPGGNIVAAVLAPGGNIAGCLKALIEKLEEGEEIRKSA